MNLVVVILSVLAVVVLIVIGIFIFSAKDNKPTTTKNPVLNRYLITAPPVLAPTTTPVRTTTLAPTTTPVRTTTPASIEYYGPNIQHFPDSVCANIGDLLNTSLENVISSCNSNPNCTAFNYSPFLKLGYLRRCVNRNEEPTNFDKDFVSYTKYRLPSNYYVINDATGISNGAYNNISLDTFGLNNNNLTLWSMSVTFNVINNSTKFQAIVCNAYNNAIIDAMGWGIWLSPLKKIHFRIGAYNIDLNLGELVNDVNYNLIINYFNNIYQLTLRRMDNNVVTTVDVSNQPKFITDRGCVTLGGRFIVNDKEIFDGKISQVSFSTPQINLIEQVIRPIRSWNISWTPEEGSVNFIVNNNEANIALAFNIRTSTTVFNSFTNSAWGAEIIINTIHKLPRPINCIVTFNPIIGFRIIYNNNIMVTFPNRSNITNMGDLSVKTTSGITVSV
jgi:hypothetical protein